MGKMEYSYRDCKEVGPAAIPYFETCRLNGL